MQSSFVHLRVHTEYSLVDGVARIKPLVQATADAGMAVGVKPIVGADLWLHNEHDVNNPSRVVLLCKNNQGYLNLTELISKSYLEGQHRGIPILQRSWLDEHKEGLIILSGGKNGDVGQALLAGNVELAEQLLTYWKAAFPDAYYIELQRTSRNGDETYIHAAVELAASFDLPVVATNDVHFINQDDYEAHEARV